MASSSLVDSSWNSPTSFSIRNRYCHCHRKASIKISESRRNPNKLYFCCSNCKFFQWFKGPEEGEVSSQRTDQRSSMQKEDQIQFAKWVEGSKDGEVSRQRAEGHSITQRGDQVQNLNAVKFNSIVKLMLIMNLVFLAVYVVMLIVKEIK